MANPLINQFAETPLQGQMDLLYGGDGVISCQVDQAQATALVPGQPVKLATTAGGPPSVISLASGSDGVFGFVAYNLKDASYPAGAMVEVALSGSVMFMTAEGAITRGASLQVDFADIEVTPALGVNPACGFALDAATVAGQLIRVLIQTPFGSVPRPSETKTINVTVPLASINAGLELIPAVAGKNIIVTDYTARVLGAFATTTSVELESDTTAVAVATLAVAALTNGAVLIPGSANTTLGAGFATALPAGEGLKVANNGTAGTGGTSIQFTISYTR